MGRLPSRCPGCGYDLTDTQYTEGIATCAECGLRLPELVPEWPWPLRCCRCRSDLTGEPVVNARVECPRCKRTNEWPIDAERAGVRLPTGVLRTCLWSVTALAVLVFVLILVFFVIMKNAWP